MGVIDKIIRKVFDNLPFRYKNYIGSLNKLVLEEFQNISYSQEGEDLILNRIFGSQKTGFYIDIGAHHPKRFSNTYFFYHLGWTGINIDPIPGVKIKFDVERPNDINLEIAIGEHQIELDYFNFKEKAFNTFSLALANQYQALGCELENVLKVKTYCLGEILDQYLPTNQTIDFLSIDIEGFELEALKSNNWDKYKPKIILAEMLDCKIEDINKNEVGKFLLDQGYVFFAKTFNTVFFKI